PDAHSDTEADAHADPDAHPEADAHSDPDALAETDRDSVSRAANSDACRADTHPTPCAHGIAASDCDPDRRIDELHGLSTRQPMEHRHLGVPHRSQFGGVRQFHRLDEIPASGLRNVLEW